MTTKYKRFEVCTPDSRRVPSRYQVMVNYPNDDESGDHVDRNHWLRINASFHVNTTYGRATIVKLQKRNAITIKAWTTNTIAKALTTNQSVKGEKNLFIKSLGLKKGRTIRTLIIIFNSNYCNFIFYFLFLVKIKIIIINDIYYEYMYIKLFTKHAGIREIPVSNFTKFG